MVQENSFVEDLDKKEEEIQNQQSKKIFVILILVIVLICGILVQMNKKVREGKEMDKFADSTSKVVEIDKQKTQNTKNLNKENNKAQQQTIEKVTTIQDLNQLNKGTMQSEKTKENIKAVSTEKVTRNSSVDPLDPMASLKNKPKQLIKPADRAGLYKQAIAIAGKTDPFNIEGNRILENFSGKPVYKYNSSYGNILPPPPAIEGLPTISGLPPIKGMFKPATRSQEMTVKGFIGNKVIVNINGVDKSLKVNETFHGVKVLKVDPENFTASFKNSRGTVTKSLNSLSDNKDGMKLVNFNK